MEKQYDEEEYLILTIESIKGGYIKAIKPYMDKLVKLRSMRTNGTIFVSKELSETMKIIQQVKDGD